MYSAAVLALVALLASIDTGISELRWSAAPRGDCPYCCPIRPERDLRYILYTRAAAAGTELVVGDNSSLARGQFNRGENTVIYLPGFSETASGQSATAIRKAYLARGGYNLLLVEWGNLVAFPWYVTAVRNTRYMGARLAELVAWLAGEGVAPGSLHLVGFSLGAEAAGFAGKILRRRGLLLGRITGLDPAYPGYSLSERSGHLARGDAAFVDVVHTNPGVLGFLRPIGDVDFYPNGPGWPVQPGCMLHEVIASGRPITQLYGCSHNRAWQLYSESVSDPRGFPATLCRRWRGPLPPCRYTVDGYMGIAAAKPMRGIMYLFTNPSPPYAKHGP